MNSNRLNEAIAILQTMNMEDCAMEIQDLINELERVKGIAFRRLEKINELKTDLAAAQVDPDLELELGREPRSHLENELADQYARIERVGAAYGLRG